MTDKFKLIRFIYLYLVTVITIVIILISAIGVINLVLKEYVFDVKGYGEFDYQYQCSDDTLLYTYDANGKQVSKFPNLNADQLAAKKADCEATAKQRAEEQSKNDNKRDLVQFLSMFVVALPLYLYHWGIIKKENRK